MPEEPEAKDPLFEYIERFAAVLVAAGFPPMPARVFVALLVTDSGRLSAAEQAAFLEFATKELGEILDRWERYRANGAAGT